MMSIKNCYIISFLVLLFSSFLLSISNDFTLYKKIEIIDPNAEIRVVDECFFGVDDNIYIRGGSYIYKVNNQGELVANIIKKGLGPEEMVMLTKINMNEKGDSLVLFDSEKNKITLFDLNGKYIRTMDPPIKKRPIFFTSNNLGDYYFFFRDKKGECLLYHLDKEFNPLNCFYPNNGIHDLWFFWSFICIDFDSKSNIYIAYPMEYLISLFDKNGTFLKSFASPGEHYTKTNGEPPTPADREKYNKWFNSLSPIYPIYVLENRALIVFYKSVKMNSPKYYDLYTLDGKRISSGILDEGFWAIGKDRQGRLVCAKVEISADGTDVTYWLYIYSLKQGTVKLKKLSVFCLLFSLLFFYY